MTESRAHAAPALDEDGRALARLLDGYAGSQVARTVALLGVPDHLSSGALSAADLAEATGTQPGPLARLLAAASLFGLVTRDEQDRFALTSTGARLRSGIEGSMRGTVAGFLVQPIWEAWNELPQIVRTGRPGGSVYEGLGERPDDAAWFARAKGQVAATVISGLAHADYRPPPAERIVDVGGGPGTLLASLLRSAPPARGVVCDRAEALSEAGTVLARAGVAGRAEVVAGSFFEEVPAGDLHVLSNMLHNWDDARARQIAANCYRASRPGGGLLVIGMQMPSSPAPSSPVYLMDLIMMVVLDGGRERSLAELQDLLAAEGWAFSRNVSLGEDLAWHATEFRRD